MLWEEEKVIVRTQEEVRERKKERERIRDEGGHKEESGRASCSVHSREGEPWLFSVQEAPD